VDEGLMGEATTLTQPLAIGLEDFPDSLAAWI